MYLIKENIYNILHDHKLKECESKYDDISITTFIKTEHNIQEKEARKYGSHMEMNFK